MTTEISKFELDEVFDAADRGDRMEALLTAAVEWFDAYRPQWGPGTLPTWYVDAKRELT